MIGQYIQTERKKVGLTQSELAKKLLISPQAISKWETGETLPDTSILLNLADALETTVDKILSAGQIIPKKHKQINIPNIKEGLKAIHDMKTYFGENSTLYQGIIEGINQKMHINFEHYYQDDYAKEVLLAEVIIQYLMLGYQTSKAEVDTYIQSEKNRSIVYKYIGEESKLKQLSYDENPQLFDQIRQLAPEFAGLNRLNELPGEFLRLEPNKQYWAAEIETDQDYCYGIAVDEKTIKVFKYGYGGSDMTLVIEEARRS